ncbi:antioxidant and copper/iron homeostasis protein [Myxozyma melibiosi]|uniref:Antioxidant and copper/iron homeostasis protein n=1 Tax=Myxozyma melibiosi TaxID=54550 RepID=A0ABR1F0Q7_9ASCO
MSSHEYQFNVAMSCSGCSGAVNRVLNKLEGVSDVKITLDDQKVIVKTAENVSYDTVLAQIKKSGKEVRSGEVVA